MWNSGVDFFPLVIWDHLRQVILKMVFWEVKVVSLQYHKRPSCKIIKRSSGVGHSRQGNLKLAVFQNGSWFFAYCQKKFKHGKVCFSSVWLGVVKNKRGYLGERTLKLAVSQAWIDEFSWFFYMSILMWWFLVRLLILVQLQCHMFLTEIIDHHSKIWSERGKNRCSALWSRNPKIGCISRRTWCNKLIFIILLLTEENCYFSSFWLGVGI